MLRVYIICIHVYIPFLYLHHNPQVDTYICIQTYSI